MQTIHQPLPPDLRGPGSLDTAEPALAATGEDLPAVRDQPADPAVGSGRECLEEVLPEIHHLAQRVGGMKRLAEIVANLEDKG